MDWARWMCLAGGVSQDAVEASRVGSDRIGPDRTAPADLWRTFEYLSRGCNVPFRMLDFVLDR